MIRDRAEVDAELAAQALTQHDVAPGSSLQLINMSENATFSLTDAQTGVRSIVRVHRPGYHDRRQIESELDWLTAVRRDGVVSVPAVLAARDGSRVVTVDGPGMTRYVVRFELMAGTHPEETAVSEKDFHELGRITAGLHQHSRQWQRPAGFDRFAWDWHASLGENPRWGRWQDSVGVGGSERRVLDRAQQLLQQRLHDHGSGPETFGLIHADLRLANLLIDSGNVTVLDFDDCGFSWFFYDFGAAVSFIEDDPALPQWQAAWLDGYRRVAAVSAADEMMLASFVMLRRLKLLAWMGTHSHALESQTKLISYAEGSCLLAENYLSSNGFAIA